MAKSVNKTKTRTALKPVPAALSPQLEEPLSPTGQWIGWGVWGGIVLVGFCFGVWVGTSKSGTMVETAQAPTPPAPTPQPAITPAPVTPPVVTPKPPEPKVEPKVVEPPPMPVTPPKVEPKTPEPPKVEPKPPEPKTPAAPTDVATVTLKDLMPLFREKCLNCHGAAGIKGGLDMRTLDAMKKGGKSGVPGVTAGDPKFSSIFTSVEDDSMPEDGVPLKPDQKKMIRDWILGGLKP